MGFWVRRTVSHTSENEPANAVSTTPTTISKSSNATVAHTKPLATSDAPVEAADGCGLMRDLLPTASWITSNGDSGQSTPPATAYASGCLRL